ncbi:MAG: hypothetical protein GY739_20100, partial [Mesoflavibacter sp.]|nr:hypothetical protein [Mesoflavibacter sp.]
MSQIDISKLLKEEEIDYDFIKKSFNDSLLDITIKPPRPPLAISVGLDDVP